MFEYLKEFPKIIVAGPQRSGTTICMHMIKNDIGFDGVFLRPVWNLKRAKKSINGSSPFIMHAPGLCRWLHEIGNQEDVAVIFMMRDIKEIIKSQERIKWNHENKELSFYDVKPKEGRRVAEVKQEYWRDHQKDHIQNAFEISYNDLKKHDMWVEPNKRKEFGSRQIK